jgi:RNA polymerase sigma factor (sigma-70 family)
MVYAVCRRLLADTHEVDDVFQATFLVLVRRARAVAWRTSIGPWLHEAAYRLSLRARALAARRRQLPVAELPDREEGPVERIAERELRSRMDEEIQRLPRSYRAPIVLCYLEGRTADEAARQLGWSEGAVRGRLARARKMLRTRLIRRGLAPAEASDTPSAAPVPTALLSATVRMAGLLASGEGISASVSRLVEGMAHSMQAAKLKTIAAVVLLAAIGGAGAGLLARQILHERASEEPQVADSPLAKPGPQGDKRVDAYGDPLPAGAVLRLGTIRFRQHIWPQGDGFTFTADGKAIAIAENQGINFWETTTGRLLQSVKTPDLYTRQVARSPDGKLIAAAGLLHDDAGMGGDAAVRLFDSASLREVRTIRWHARADRMTLAFTPDSKTFVTFGEDGVLRFWDASSGSQVLEHRVAVGRSGGDRACVAFSPDGKLLACGGMAGEIQVWEWQSTRAPRDLPTRGHGASYLAFSPDGKTLAASGQARDGVRLWEVVTRGLRAVLPIPERDPFPAEILYAGPWLLANSRQAKTIRVFDASSHQLIRTLDTSPLGGVRLAVSPDAKMVAALSGHTVRVWRLPTGEEIARPEAAHVDPIAEAAFSPNGETVATAGHDGSVRLWDARTGSQRRAWLGHDARGVAFSPDGRLLALGTLRGDHLLVVDAISGKEIYSLPGHSRAGGHRPVRFTPDGKQLISWGDDLYLRVWNVRNGKAVAEHALKPRGLALPATDDSVEALKQQREFILDVGEATISPDGKMFVLVAGNQIHVFDVASGAELRQFPGPVSAWGVSGMAVSADGSLLLAAVRAPNLMGNPGNSHFVRLWSLASGQLVRELTLPGGQAAGPVAFSPDGTLFAVGPGEENEGQVVFYSTATGKEVSRFEHVPGRLMCLAFSADGRRLVAGVEDTTALVWDLD